MTNLQLAIQSIHPRDLIDSYLPQAHHKTPRGRVRCIWREGTHASGFYYRNRKDGKMRLYDPVTTTSYDSYAVLVELCGLDKREAARELLKRAGLERDRDRSSNTNTVRDLIVQLPPKVNSTVQMPEKLKAWLEREQRATNPLTFECEPLDPEIRALAEIWLEV